ncbi:hypothetical protein SLOPH_2325 [Spraguea lophii 42_110]|uniref:Uncharacterized protein n=1 Tax=Spraguea lophii (strain 42_110) TaxID=1358809 RepID=S7XFU4_SPRLO|nr:hypothetical protein SLOPH_2325 [Spraguea lophii 42_110]
MHKTHNLLKKLDKLKTQQYTFNNEITDIDNKLKVKKEQIIINEERIEYISNKIEEHRNHINLLKEGIIEHENINKQIYYKQIKEYYKNTIDFMQNIKIEDDFDIIYVIYVIKKLKDIDYYNAILNKINNNSSCNNGININNISDNNINGNNIILVNTNINSNECDNDLLSNKMNIIYLNMNKKLEILEYKIINLIKQHIFSTIKNLIFSKNSIHVLLHYINILSKYDIVMYYNAIDSNTSNKDKDNKKSDNNECYYVMYDKGPDNDKYYDAMNNKDNMNNITTANIMIVEMLYSFIYKEFSYYFLSNRKTNRLDKPEWLFEFFIKKINSYGKILKYYEEMSIDNIDDVYDDINEYNNKISCEFLNKNNNINDNKDNILINISTNNTDNNVTNTTTNNTDNNKVNDLKILKEIFNYTYLKYRLLLKINNLICLKVEEIHQSSSKQLRNLILHFCDEYKKFIEIFFNKNEINILNNIILGFRKFNITTNNINYMVKINLLEIEVNHINLMMSSIFNYGSKIFYNLKKLYKEEILIACSFRIFDERLASIVGFMNDRVVEYFSKLLNCLRYISKEENEELFKIFVEIEQLKEYLIHLETDIEYGDNNINNKNHNGVNNMLIDTGKLIIFNKENLITIKNILENDFNREIYGRVFRSKHFYVELSNRLIYYKNIFDEYYVIIESFMGSLVDDKLVYYIQNSKMAPDDLFSLKDTISKIKTLIPVRKDWECDKYRKCVEMVFNGVKEDSEIYRRIAKNYI